MPVGTTLPARATNSIWSQISELARWTPSPHNTQPFRVRVTDDTRADLICLCERLLPEEDHGNRYMAAAFGTFAVGLELAAARCGVVLRVTLDPEVEPENLFGPERERLLGRAELVDGVPKSTLSPMIEPRRTSRLEYDGRSVDPACVTALQGVAESHGQRFHSHGDAESVQWVLRANAHAVIDNLQIPDEREEIRAWYRSGPTPPTGDGLWQVPMNQPAWEMTAAFAFPWLFALPGLRGLVCRRYIRSQAGTRNVGLVCGPFDTWPQLYQAGRMLMFFWLTMASHGVFMHPYGSLLTNPDYAQRVAERFSVQDTWLIFRFGYSPPPPRSPRLSSILADE